jgi:hypothetical protein
MRVYVMSGRLWSGQADQRGNRDEDYGKEAGNNET